MMQQKVQTRKKARTSQKKISSLLTTALTMIGSLM
jgi:hypothetical protein